MRVQLVLLACLGWQCLSRAAEVWTQTTDADFGAGTRTCITIAGSGAEAALTLASAPFAWKRHVTVTNPTAAGLTDIPVRVALSAANFDFSRTRGDGADVRFLDGDEVTPLAFWIESWDSTASPAVVWVKLPALAASASRTIYLYYGSAAAEAASSGADTFPRFDDFDSLSAWSQSGSGVSVAGSVVTLDSGANPTISTTLTVPAPFTVEVKYQQPSSFRNRLYLTKPATGSPTGYDYGIFESLFWSGFSGVTLIPNTWYVVRWDNTLTNYTWRLLAMNGSEVFSRSHGSAIAGLNTLNFAGTDRSDSDFKLDWMRVRPYAASEPTAAVGAEASAAARVLFSTVGSFVSPAFDTGMYARLALAWEADTPAGTAVRFQVRTAATQAGLASAAWRGPTGPDDWLTVSGSTIDLAGSSARWVQVKAVLTAPTTEVSANLNSVTLTYGPGDVVISANATWPEGDYALDTLIVTNGATLALGGGSTLTATGTISLTGNSTLLLQGKNTTGQADGAWAGTGGAIHTANLVIEGGSSLSANGQGYAQERGPGAGFEGWYCGGGASHAGAGTGTVAGTTIYGSAIVPVDLGSGGGRQYDTPGGTGGGAIRLAVSGTLTLNGRVTAEGTDMAGNGGGGAGGSIYATLGTLAGSGSFCADGGNQGSGRSAAGGGGRIAVYYSTDGGYTGFATSTAFGGTTPGARAGEGTVGFFQAPDLANPTTDPNRVLYVFHTFRYEQENSTLVFGGVTVGSAAANGATLKLAGGATVTVSGTVAITGNSTIQIQGKDTTGQVNGAWAGTGGAIHTANLVVEAGSSLSANGQGYAQERGPGAGFEGWYCGGGASHAGAGTGTVAGTTIYGSAIAPVDLGSGGGHLYETPGGTGGGAIRLAVSGTLTLNGRVTAKGTDMAGNGGGGAGGSIYATLGTLAGSGSFCADGGNQGGDRSAAGGGGRIAVYYSSASGYTGFATSTAFGGTTPGGRAGEGTVGFFQAPDLANPTTDPSRQLQVYHTFRYEQAGGSASLGGITLRSVDSSGAQLRLAKNFTLALTGNLAIGQVDAANAHLSVGGGSVIRVGGTLSVEGESSVLLQSVNEGGMASGQWQGQGVEIHAADLVVGTGSIISADAQGYAPGVGPAVGSGNSGGTYAGMGGRGPWGSPLTTTYGNALAPFDLGSGGGAFDALGAGQGGSGGGAIYIEVTGLLTLEGEISADGQHMNTGRGDGGGAGGSVYIVTHGLTGAGIFTAEGGSSMQNRGGGGGGGRIAVRYATAAGYTGFTGTTAGGGTGANSGQSGTSVFIDTSVPRDHLRFYQRFVLAAGSQGRYGAITLDDAASLVVGGGSELTVDGALTVRGGSTVFVMSTDSGGPVGGVWLGAGSTFLADTLTIEAGSGISADFQGYPQALGPGSVGGSGNSGGTHAGVGGTYWGAPNQNSYGNALAPFDLGSGGGTYDALGGGQGGAGGGAVRVVVAGTLTLDGGITADGQSMDTSRADGGGAGGSVQVWTGVLTGSGRLSADGGASVSYRGGGGGGGRVVVSASALSGNGQMSATGGNGNGPGGGGQVTLYTPVGSPTWALSASGGNGGTAGSTLVSPTPAYAWIADGNTCSHDTETLCWASAGGDAASTTFRLTAVGGHGEILLASGPVWIMRADWDTTFAPDGTYELRATFLDAAGDEVGRLTRQLLVNNSVVWHSGPITANETWTADQVHLVEGDVTIASGVTVTVEPGTLVKFVDGTRVTLSNGASLNAAGSADTPVIFTSLRDDTAGGDTNYDGSTSLPQPGSWDGIVMVGNGTLGQNDYTEIRYAQASHTGALTGDQTWDGSWTHLLSGDVIVPNRVTLTIAAGAVVKLGAGKSLMVQPGGRLVAVGSVALPIVFTSERDDSVGGDSNGDGSTTQAKPGDWYRLYVDGGVAYFNHVQMRYGSGTDSTQAGLIRSNGAAQVTVANSILTDGYYTGILAWGGTVTVTNTVIAGLDRGISAHPGGTLEVTNCTLDDNRIGLLLHGGSLTAVNCIVSHSTEYGIDNDLGGPAPTVQYGNVWGSGILDYRGVTNQTGLNGNLSVDPLYRSRAHGDFRLGYVSPCIDAGDGSVAPVTDLAGAPRYDDPRTPNTGIPVEIEPGSVAYADLGAYEFVESAGSAIDLIVTAVAGPLAATAGETATLSWTVTNLGTATATGPWHDTVALVRDPDTAPVAVFAGEVLVGSGVTLGPGASCLAAGTVRVPGSTVGLHRWQVTTNTRGEVFEGANTTNNTAVSLAPVVLAVPLVTVDGEVLTGQFSAVGESQWFAFLPEPGQDLLLSLDLADAAGAVELYLGAGYIPSPQHFDSRQTEWNSARVSALVVNSTAQTYYALVRNTALSGSRADFTLGAAVLDFQLNSVSPSAVGNSGPVTLRLRGGKLTGALTYQLVDAEGGARAATQVYVVDSAQVCASFDLTGATPGSYSVRVSTALDTAELEGAVTVTATVPGRFEVNLIMPALARVGRVFRAYVEYANVGGSDLVAPILYVRSADGALFTRDLTASPAVTEDEFLAVAAQAPVGILQPGQKVTVPLLVRALRGTTQLEVSYIDTNNDTPMAWAYLADRLASTYGADPQFAAVLAAMKTTIGTTWGDYDRRLAANASLLPAALGDPAELNRLLNLQYRRVQATLGASLSGRVDTTALGRSLAGQRLGATLASGVGGALATYILNDGSFVLPRVAAGTYVLEVQGADVGATTPATLSVAPGTPLAGVVVTVAPQDLVSGTVRDATGAAVLPGTLVWALSGEDVVGVGPTDAAGRYTLTGVPPGTYTFVVNAEGQAQLRQEDLALAAGNPTLDLTMQPQAVIAGTAVLPAGAPAAGLFVFATPTEGAAPLALFSAAGDADGNFSLAGLPEGSYELSFSDFSDGLHEAAVAGLVVAAAGRLDLGTVPLARVAKDWLPAPAPKASGAPTKGLSMAGTDDESIYDPGAYEPLLSAWHAKVLALQGYLRLSLLPTEYELFGREVSMLWNEFISSTSADPAPRLSYGADSQIVEGATTPCGSGFRSYDLKDGTENIRVQQIRDTVLAGVKAKFKQGTLTCDQIIENNGSKVFLLTVENFPRLEFRFGKEGSPMHNLLNLTGYPYITPQGKPDTNDQMGSYSGAYNIPSNIAGGTGTAQPFTTPGTGVGQQYHDTRHWTGLVRATVAGKGQVTLHYEVDWVANDTIDFRPGDLGIPIQHALTVPMAFLEAAGRAFDVPFHVQYKDERFAPQTFTIEEGQPPECPDAERPPKPDKPGGQGGTSSNEATDPNELVGPAGFGPQGFVQAQQVFPYTIHFENVATASAPAQQVVVTDALDPNLDGATFQLTQIGFNDVVIEVPAGLQEYTTQVNVGTDLNPVKVSVSFDPATGLITWDLLSVDPLTGLLVEDPLAGFLPPNLRAPAGEGYVSFTVRPKAGLPSGTRISNQASIVFDVNAPILTNTVLNTLDVGVPVGAVTALPVYSPYPDFTVSWTGTDDPGGSGVASYDVFVAEDGGPFTAWLSRSPAASAVFPGRRGHSYAFYAVARDGVEHTEVQAEPLAEAQTRVLMIYDDVDRDGLPDWFEAVIINADPGDAIVDFTDVQPGGDFETVPPHGASLAVVGAVGVASGGGLWDLTGEYATPTKGNRLTLDLLHDTKGKLSGTATYTLAEGPVVSMPIRGNVKGSSGSLTMVGTLRGSSPSRALSVSLRLGLTLDASRRKLTGPLSGSIRTSTGTTTVNDTVSFDLEGNMKGTWTLEFQLEPSGRAITGSARLTLSNDVSHSFLVRGRSVGQRALLSLAGAPTDPAAKAIAIRTTVTPMVGGWARLEALLGSGYGQVLRR